jgi:hypothetical protein
VQRGRVGDGCGSVVVGSPLPRANQIMGDVVGVVAVRLAGRSQQTNQFRHVSRWALCCAAGSACSFGWWLMAGAGLF